MAKDAIHDAVKNALVKDGWTILKEHVHLTFGELEGYVDIAAERSPIVAEKGRRQIMVEIKSFSSPSFMRDFQQAIGQYSLYRDLIELSGLSYQLILAVPDSVYDLYLTRPATSLIISRHSVRLLAVNIKTEEIIEWTE